jgi:DNA gyrase/topoisomerase IV subunit A
VIAIIRASAVLATTSENCVSNFGTSRATGKPEMRLQSIDRFEQDKLRSE